MARPPTYNLKLAQIICARVAEGKSSREIAELDGMPSRKSIFQWLALNPEFSDLYARAKHAHYLSWEEDILDIADDGTNDWMERQREHKGIRSVENAEAINRSRLRVDTRKWLLSKLMPKKYGDKIENLHGGLDGGPIQVVTGVVRSGDGQ